MKISKLADFFVQKYAEISPAQLESDIRKDIHALWKFPNDIFNILRACAESAPKNPKTTNQVKAIEGYKFCKELLTMIDYLQSNVDTISLGEIRELLNNIVVLIRNNIHLKFDINGKPSEKGEKSSIQFPHVSELIFEMIPTKTKHDRTVRDRQFGKAKTGLSRIFSLVITMLEKIAKLEIMIPEKFKYTNITNVDINQDVPDRFSPDRVALSIYDIIDFIRQHGIEYGISTTEDWEIVFRNDPQLKEEITTIINAINRGHYPRNSANLKMEIAKILKEHEERKSSNVAFFE